MAYSGLETLFQNMGPTFAATMAGEREGTAQGLDTLDAMKKMWDNKKAEQDLAQSAAMNPLKLQEQRGVIARQGAELPGLQATSQKLQQEADIGKASLPSAIAKAISSNDLTTAQNSLKQLQNANTMIQQTVMSYPEGPQGEAMLAADIASGKIPHAQAEQIKRMGSLANNQRMAAQLATTTNKLSEAFQQAVAVQQLHLEGVKYTADTHASTQKAVEGMRLEEKKLGKKDEAAAAKVKFMQLPVERQLMVIEQALTSGDNPFTGEPMSTQEMEILKGQKAKGEQIYNAQLAARTQAGVAPTMNAAGKLELTNKVVPQVGATPTKPALPAGWVMK